MRKSQQASRATASRSKPRSAWRRVNRVSQSLFAEWRRLFLARFLEREKECSSLIRAGLCPNSPAITLHNSLADREPQSRSWIFVLIKPFKEAENSLGLTLFKPDSIVSDHDDSVGHW